MFAAYHALALTDPALAAQPYANPSRELENGIAQLLERASMPSHVDSAAEAANLLALATGLGDGVMGRLRTPDAAIALLDYHLDRLFTAENRPATSTKVSGGPPGPASPA